MADLNTFDSFIDQEGVYYLSSQEEAILKAAGHVTEGQPVAILAEQNSLSGGISDFDTFVMDVAQSHHFSVTIEGLPAIMAPEGVMGHSKGEGLPVKNINLNYTSYENMSIPLAIFGDSPLLSRKRVSTISLSCYDEDSNKLEYALKEWENSCFPYGRYVAYMDDIARKFDYRGYGVDGRETLRCAFYVIPAGSVNISRDYSANDAKLVNFNLVCVGDGSTSATGTGNIAYGTTVLRPDGQSSYTRYEV